MHQLLPLLLLTSLLTSRVYSKEGAPQASPFVYNGGRNDAKVKVDFYVDPLCPDSAAAWNSTLAMASHYGPRVVQLNVHIFPLPYHRNSFYVSKAAYAVDEISNGTQTFEWIRYMLHHELYHLWNAPYHDKTDADLLAHLSSIADTLGLDGDALLAAISKRAYNANEAATRHTWKAAAARGVFATPMFSVNGQLNADISQAWTTDPWRHFIDGLID